MNNGKTTEDVKCELHQLERNRYFYGKLMTVRDFETEQRYVREHRHLHNQSLHGWGVVCGLIIEPKGGTGNETKVVVKPGIALDCCGHEIVLAKDQDVDLRDFQQKIETVMATGKNTVYLCIKYDECDREPVPALANVSTCEEVCEYNRIQEKVDFELLTELPTAPEADPCEIFMNLRTARSEIKEGETVIAEFERFTPFWVRQGEVFEVRRKIKPLVSGITIRVADTLPNGFGLLDGSLEMEVADTIEGKVVNSTYLVRVDDSVTPTSPPDIPPYLITGEVLQSPPTDDLAQSPVVVIPATEPVEERVQRVLFNQQFKQCPRCADDHSNRCVILARITLQQQDSSFIIPTDGIDNVTFDAANGIHRRLVYSTSLIADLLKCLGRQPREQMSAQKVAVLKEGNLVATRTQLNFTGAGVSASPDTANNDRVNINIPGGAAARIFTGEIDVEIVIGGSVRPKEITVNELESGEPFAVILAPQLPEETRPVFDPPLNRAPGAHFIFGSHPNFGFGFGRIFVAFIPQPYDKKFEIHGSAPEFAPIEGPPLTIKIVYWVIAGAQRV